MGSKREDGGGRGVGGFKNKTKQNRKDQRFDLGSFYSGNMLRDLETKRPRKVVSPSLSVSILPVSEPPRRDPSVPPQGCAKPSSGSGGGLAAG